MKSRNDKKCPNCRQNFTEGLFSELNKMNRQLRNILDEIEFKCGNCDEKFPYGQLEKHWESCLREKKCTLCE